MKVIIPGGSGLIGTVLARAFVADGAEVVVLSRTPSPAPWRTVAWDARTVGPWASELEGADLVVNLAGRSVNCRYDAANRREIMQSRLDSVRAIGLAIVGARKPPAVWMQAATATIYAHRHDAPNDEATGIVGGDDSTLPETWKFSTGVATAWERAVDEFHTPATRKLVLRMAMTMSPDRGGVFDTLLWLVRCGLGGAAGDGRQYVSWIHETDFVRAVRFLLAHPEISGAVNFAAPEPLPNAEFMRTLREAWGVPCGLPATGWMIEAGARVLGTESELVLKSRRVVPGRLVEAGFRFEYPAWGPAAEELCRRRTN